MGFVLPSGVVNTDSVYFYATDAATPFGPHVKQPSDQTLVVIDYSKLSVLITLASYSFTVDVSSNPNLVVAYPQLNATGNVLTFLLSGGIAGQQYQLTITAKYPTAPFVTGTRTDVLTISIPSSAGDCETINPVPALYNQVPLVGDGYVNTGVRYFYGQVAPANPNLLDQWFNTATNVLYEWVSDGNSLFWDIISSPNYVMEAPLDGQLYSRMSSGWTPTPIQSDAPSALVMYVREQGAWAPLPPPVITTDAPHDGQLYGRQGSGWALAYSVSNPAGYLSATDVNSALSQYMPLAGGSFSGNVNFSVSASFATPANLNIGGGAPGNQLVTNGAGVLSWNAPPGYVLPVASTTVLGGVKIDGSTISISGSGVISAAPATVTISATPPVSPAVGSLWFDDVGAQLYLYYNDGTSSQWVPAVNQAGAGGGPSGLPPSNTVAPVVSPPGSTTIGQPLTCSTGLWTQTPTSFGYQWLRDSIAITGAVTSSYTVQSSDASHSISCSVTAANANGSASASSNAVSVAALAPTISIAPVVTGTGAVGQTLSTTNGTWNNVPTGYTYQWQRDGAAIIGATISTYLLVGADATHLVSCVVTASNSGGSASSLSNAISVAAAIPAIISAPTVTGTGALGATLTLTSNGSWTNSPTSYAYQWQRGVSNITGATGTTYVVQAGDVGLSVTCAVTAYNSYGNGTASSNAIAVVAAPVNSVAPVVSGSPHPGSTLNTTNGTWSGSPTYTYQWYRDGTTAIGANSSSYLLVSGDATHNVSCTVTATNAGGSASAGSNSLAISVAPPVNSVAPVVTPSSAILGQTLTTNNGTWSNSPTGYTYQWLRDGTNIVGATTTSYSLVIADCTHSISCAVTATNSGGSATAGSNSVAVPAQFFLPATAQAVYSLRQAVTGYAGKCVNVLRFSDGATMDLGFNSAGMLDMVAAATFAGGSMLYVMKWYDQSGNTGNDATQTASGIAPQLINFNGSPQVAFASLNTLKTAAAISLTGDQTIGLFLQDGSNAAGFPICCWDTSHGWAVYLNGNGPGTISTIYDGSVGPADTSNLLAGSLHQVVLTKASGAVKIYADGVQTGSGSASSTTGASTNPVNIGSLQQNSFQFQGLISEVYLYPSALTPTQIAAINANEVATFPQTGFQNYYNGSCAVQPGAGNYLTFGNVLDYEYTQPWTMYAQVHMFSVGGGAEGGIGANIDHATGPTFKGYLVAALLSIGSPYIPGALSLRIISDLNANKHLQLAGTKSLCDGQPHLLAVTWDGSGVAAGFKAYIDGVQDTLTVIADALGGASIVGGTQNFSVGCQANDGGNAVNGRVGFFQMDNVVRSQSYIATNFTLTTQPPNTANTVMRLMMSEGSGTTVHDTSASGFTGTLTSSGMWVP